MKNKTFIGLTTAACILVSVVFIQTTTAESSDFPKRNFESCKVQKNNANFFVRATEKTIKLKAGTLLSWTIYDMQQGLIVVKAKIGKKWVLGEILLDDTTCN